MSSDNIMLSANYMLSTDVINILFDNRIISVIMLSADNMMQPDKMLSTDNILSASIIWSVIACYLIKSC
jgi:hypothetical protein